MNIHICVNTEFPVPHSPFRTEQLHERANALRMYGLPAHWSEIANASWTDRLVHRAVVIAIEGKPYRVKEARQRAEQRAKKRNAARPEFGGLFDPLSRGVHVVGPARASGGYDPSEVSHCKVRGKAAGETLS